MKWQTLQQASVDETYLRMQNVLNLQSLLRRESLTSSLPVSLLPPTRKKVKDSKQLADGLMVGGENGDGEYYLRLGLWASRWLPAFLLTGKR